MNEQTQQVAPQALAALAEQRDEPAVAQAMWKQSALVVQPP